MAQISEYTPPNQKPVGTVGTMSIVETGWHNEHCCNLLTGLLQVCCEHILLTSCKIFTCEETSIYNTAFHVGFYCMLKWLT
jgi:hypothetical protein